MAGPAKGTKWTTPSRGECPHCHEDVGLRRDGTVRLHPKDKGSGATGADCRANCYGSYAFAVKRDGAWA